jgi:hypothetical protein
MSASFGNRTVAEGVRPADVTGRQVTGRRPRRDDQWVSIALMRTSSPRASNWSSSEPYGRPV